MLDTCLAVQLAQASDILLADLDKVLDVRGAAPTSIRTQSVSAATMVSTRNPRPLVSNSRGTTRSSRATGNVWKTRGPSLNLCNFGRHRARQYRPAGGRNAEKLGLTVEPVSTQVIRDRHAAFFATLAVIASSVERLAVEIRHLQRTEVREAEEFFSEGQRFLRDAA